MKEGMRMKAAFLAVSILLLSAMPMGSAAYYQVNEKGEYDFHYVAVNRSLMPSSKDVYRITFDAPGELFVKITLESTVKQNLTLYFNQSNGGSGFMRNATGTTIWYGDGPTELSIEVHVEKATEYNITINGTYQPPNALEKVVYYMGGPSMCCVISLMVIAVLGAAYYRWVKRAEKYPYIEDDEE